MNATCELLSAFSFEILSCQPIPAIEHSVYDGDLNKFLIHCISNNIEVFNRLILAAEENNQIIWLDAEESECGLFVVNILTGKINRNKVRELVGTDLIQSRQIESVANNFDCSKALRRFLALGGTLDYIESLKRSEESDFLKNKVKNKELYNIAVSVCFWDEASPMTHFECIDIRLPEIPPIAKNKRKSASVKREQTEALMEAELKNWLLASGYAIEQQVNSSGGRFDLWVPDRFVIELKKGKVNGNDICQVITYLSSTKLPIIIVAQSIGDRQLQAIESINNLLNDTRILFVQWSAAKTTLPSLLRTDIV